MQNAHIIETALLLLIAFLIGCAIGWFVRTRFYGTAAPDAGSGTARAPAAPADEPVTAAVEPAAMITPDAAKPATKKPAAKKTPAAKKPPAAKTAARKPAATKSTAKKPAAKKPATRKPAASAAASPAAAPPAEAGKPQGLSTPRAGGKDDLKKISGVGPKLEEKLNNLGIFHFDQIAGWDSQTIEWVDNHLSFKGRIARDNWVDQAKSMTKD